MNVNYIYDPAIFLCCSCFDPVNQFSTAETIDANKSNMENKQVYGAGHKIFDYGIAATEIQLNKDTPYVKHYTLNITY